jgi:lichenan operon transcriptional antiterminator
MHQRSLSNAIINIVWGGIVVRAREIIILRMLLQKEHVLPAEFTNRLAISLRTVRMDIRSLNEYYKAIYEHSGDTLIRSSPTRGYYIHPSDEAGAR